MQAVGLAETKEGINDSFAEALTVSEYGYYLVIVYTVLAAPLGLILMGDIGAGFLLVLVLAMCTMALGPALITVLRQAWIPIACGVSHLFIQLAIHGELMHRMYVYQFGPWIISLVIVQALVIHRPRFFHRFAWFTLYMGVAMLPFVSWTQTGAYERLGLDRNVGYSNANAMAAWFGFCTLYLTLKGYIETRLARRIVTWFLAAGSLYIVTMTVSRGALLALAASLFVAGRRFFKIGIFPLLLLAGSVVGLMEIGVFDQALNAYGRRAGEETGRFLVWPLLIEQFINSPFIGLGVSYAGAFITSGRFITPHNCFLLFAVTSGVVPLVLFCAYCLRSGMAALRASGDGDSIYYLPLVVYTVLIASFGNIEFMAPWAVVSLSVPLASISHLRDRIKKIL
jgi:hypothetical protein